MAGGSIPVRGEQRVDLFSQRDDRRSSPRPTADAGRVTIIAAASSVAPAPRAVAAPPAAVERKRRRVGSTDVFVNGVLCMLSARVMELSPFMAWVRAGAEVDASPRLAFRLNQYSRMSIKAKPKKRGRPATGRDPMMGFRASPMLRASIVRWAENQPDGPSLSEATRRLVELGLTVTTKARPTGPLRAARVADLAAEAIDSLGLKVKTPARPVSKPSRRLRAQELATKTIEKIFDPAAPPEERALRRRRLAKGPTEFREDRVDLPKAKK